jgi:putative transposon-encoded protein
MTGRPRNNPIQTDEHDREYFETVVTAQGTTGRVYPPASWIGTRVRVVKIE